MTVEDATIEAVSISDAKEKLLFTIHNYSGAGNILELSYPISLEIYTGGNLVFSQKNISRDTLKDVYPFHSASASGRYEIYITDARGFKSYRNFDLFADVASRIDPILSTSVVETGGNVSTHLVTVLDQYDNPAAGEIYTLDISIEGDGVVFESNNETSISYSIVE